MASQIDALTEEVKQLKEKLKVCEGLQSPRASRCSWSCILVGRRELSQDQGEDSGRPE